MNGVVSPPQLGPGTHLCLQTRRNSQHTWAVRRRNNLALWSRHLLNAVRGKGVFYFPFASRMPLCHNFAICMEVDLTGVERVAFLHRRNCALMDVVKEITSSGLLLQQ
jgi:hypothetical protein